MTPAKLDTNEEHPSEASMEVHPAIQMVIARMESHPEEFFIHKPPSQNMTMRHGSLPAVMSQTVEQTKGMWNRKEKRLYNMALRKVRLEEAQQRFMKAMLTN